MCYVWYIMDEKTQPKKETIKIVQKDDPVLKVKAREVDLDEFGTLKITNIINRMKQALLEQEDGVAIAAPQIGESLRIFVVSKRLFELEGKTKTSNQKDLVFINPKIINTSKKKMIVEEGCLSVRWLYGKVERFEKVKIEAFDENGKKNVFGGSELMAQVFQHEIDHLDGTLFIEKASDLKDMPPESLKVEDKK